MHVVLDKQHGDAPALEFFQQLFQRMGLRGVHARRRFVQQQQARLAGQRPGDFETALVAIRQIARATLRGVGKAHEVDQLPGLFERGLLGPAEAGQAQQHGG